MKTKKMIQVNGVICKTSEAAAEQKCGDPDVTEQALTIADGLVCRSLSLRISFSMLSLMASLHARWQISVRSAPEKPLVIFARKSKSTSYQQRNHNIKKTLKFRYLSYRLILMQLRPD